MILKFKTALVWVLVALALCQCDKKTDMFQFTEVFRPPSIHISDINIIEGDTGSSEGQFVVSLSRPHNQEVSVNYSTVEGTAKSNVDYVSTSGTLTLPAGVTQAVIVVKIIGDVVVEPDETFLVKLSQPVKAHLGDEQAVGTILTDDKLPSLSINDITLTEGNSGATTANFIVTLSSGLNSGAVTVNYATADGTAMQSSDYTGRTGTLTFAPGVTSQTVSIGVNSDDISEPTETFFISLFAAYGATLSDTEAVATITDDDPVPSLSIDDVTITEGNSGFVVASFTLNLIGQSSQAVSVNYDTSDGTATSGSDYVATSGKLTFEPTGPTSANILVSVFGDVLFEQDETFFVTLTDPVQATFNKQQGLGRILNDDPTPPPKMTTDRFEAIGPQIDLLMMMDNSKSMGKSIGAIRDATINFFDTLQQKRLVDWWAMVVMVNERNRAEDFGDPIKSVSGIDVVKSQVTPDPVSVLDDILTRLPGGTSRERGLDASIRAIEEHSPRFSRPGVPLTIMWLTDAESKDCGWSIDRCSGGNISTDVHIKYYRNMPILPLLYPIVALRSQPRCQEGIESYGARYVLVQKAIGTGRVGSICNNQVAKAFVGVADDLSNRGECYVLLNPATGNYISVRVNVVTLPSADYRFEASTNSVCFSSTQSPPVGSEILISYEMK